MNKERKGRQQIIKKEEEINNIQRTRKEEEIKDIWKKEEINKERKEEVWWQAQKKVLRTKNKLYIKYIYDV